jgi:Icc-related predicted phosphoesterase
MRLVFISDTHNHTAFDVPPGDVLVHCGDGTMRGSDDEIMRLRTFLSAQPHERKLPRGRRLLVTHGPPHGILDEIDGEQVGCTDLLAAVKRIGPRVHAFGHIHVAYGTAKVGKTTFVNAAVCGEDYLPHNAPIVVDI